MKVADDELRRRLNLVESSKTFVLKEVSDDGRASVQSCQVVPNDDGVYWVGGTTQLHNKTELKSVFRVDTNSGGSLLAVFWLVNGDWFEHDSEETFESLGIERDEAFPFDWTYQTPLENDVFHSA